MVCEPDKLSFVLFIAKISVLEHLLHLSCAALCCTASLSEFSHTTPAVIIWTLDKYYQPVKGSRY